MRKHIETRIEIDAPVDVVWAALTDRAQLSSWNDFLLRAEGEPAEGARWRVEIKMGARKPMRFTPRVVEWRPRRALRWLGHTGVRGVFDGEHGFVMEPIADARTRFVHEERFSGVLARPILWMLGGDVVRGFEAFNQALKARAEALFANATR